MKICTLKLTNFRNFKEYKLEPERVTILVGPNGVGKTNIVEAMYLASVCRSYRTRRDSEVIYWGEQVARVSVSLTSEKGDALQLAIAQDGDKKIAFVGEKLGLKINLFLRLNPLIDLGNYTTRYQQYGIPYPDAKKAVDYAMKHPHLELTGFHFHGSYISDPQVYVMAAQKLLKVVRYATDLGAKIKYLDLGGGFPPNDNSHPQYGKMYDLPEGGKKIVEGIQKLLQKYQLAAPYLIFEPGKHIVSNAMMALTKIVSEKNMGKNKMVILNGSVYNLVADIFVSKLTYHFLPANKMRQPRTERYRITGSTCDCIDVFSKGEAMPKLEKDDLLMIMDCGAYSEVFASNFNSLKRAPIILISPDGTTKLVRRRDRYAEMFAPQLDALKVADPNELKFFYNLHRINIEKIWNDKPELEKLKKPIKALLQSLQKNSAT